MPKQEPTTMEERWEAQFGDTTSCRLPGLFQLYEMQYVLKPGIYYEVFYTGEMTDGTRLWKASPRDSEVHWDSLDPLDPADTGGRDPEEIIHDQFDWLPGEYTMALDLEQVIEKCGDGYFILHEVHPNRTIKVPDEKGDLKDRWEAAAYRIGHRRMRSPKNPDVGYDWNPPPDPITGLLNGVRAKVDMEKVADGVIQQALLARALDTDDPELVEPKERDKTPN